jgi:hypothetical protein
MDFARETSPSLVEKEGLTMAYPCLKRQNREQDYTQDCTQIEPYSLSTLDPKILPSVSDDR